MKDLAYSALLVGVAVAGLMLMLMAIRKIPPDHRGVLFRLGRLVGELPPGTAWIIPFVDSVMLVDLREQTYSLPPGLIYSDAARGGQYAVNGSFACQVVAPIPTVIAARQARRDLVEVVADETLRQLQKLLQSQFNPAESPERAQREVLAALNEQMSKAWQVKFTQLVLKIGAA